MGYLIKPIHLSKEATEKLRKQVLKQSLKVAERLRLKGKRNGR